MFRVQKDKSNPYVMLNKEFLNDERLSWKAKGVLAYLLSLPDDWQIYEDEIYKHSKDGKDSLRSSIKELIEKGYIDRARTRDEKGRLKGYEYRVYEVSIQMGFSNVGKTNVGESNTTNNNLTNNKNTNNERLHQIENLTHPLLEKYLEIRKEYIDSKHKRISESTYRKFIKLVDDFDISLDELADIAYEHFNNLPKDNDGDISYFIEVFRRYI